MKYFICSLLGYLIGSFNTAFFMGRRYGYADIREEGTNNAGASNVGFVLGKGAGVFVALVDIMKVLIAVECANVLFPKFLYRKVVTGVSAVLGHIFPFYLDFKGGKGLASLAGLIIAISSKLFVILAVVFALVVVITNYLVCGVVVVAVTFPIIVALYVGKIPGLMVSILSVVMLRKHKDNFFRIKNGLEFKIRYIWHKDEKEEFKERYKNYYGIDEEERRKLAKR